MAAVQRRPVLSREFVEANRRRNFARAAAEIVHESGIHIVTVDRICQTARSTRSTFYNHFSNADDCLRYGVREGLELLFAPLRRQGGEESEADWLLGVDRAITSLYTAIAAEPSLAELILVHSPAIPQEDDDLGLDAGIAIVKALLAEGREHSPAAGEMVPLTEDFLARVIVSLAALKLSRGEVEMLPLHGREMTVLVGNAYLGVEQTTRILGPANAKAQSSAPK